MGKKLFAVVETNKMAMESVASLIDVDGIASTDLENGRLVKRSFENGVTKYEYVKDATDEIVFLVTTVEKVYTGDAIDTFFNPAGKKIRTVQVVLGDEFSTTAIPSSVKAGDKVIAGKDGKLVAGAEGSVVFEVLGKRMLNGTIGATVKRVK